MAEEIKESESMKITALARKMRDRGEDVITLSIGDSHFSPPENIKNKVIKNINDGKTHYLGAQGIYPLRKKINNFYYNNKFDEDDIIIVPGLKQGLFYLLNSLKGKKVCLLEPYWLGYKATIKLVNKNIISVKLKNENWINELNNKDFDTLIMCNPNNPDGKIFSEKEMRKVIKICKSKDSYLISDEIYKHFDYIDKYISSSEFNYDKLITIDGFSKAFAVSGLRIGFMVIKNNNLLSNVKKLQQNIATCTNSLAQHSLLDFDKGISEVKDAKKYYEKNKDIVVDIIPEFKKYKPDGGFYYFVDLSNFGISDGFEFSKKLLKEKKVAVVPGSAYGNGFDSWIRFSFSVERENLKEGMLRLKEFISI